MNAVEQMVTIPMSCLLEINSQLDFLIDQVDSIKATKTTEIIEEKPAIIIVRKKEETTTDPDAAFQAAKEQLLSIALPDPASQP